MINIGTSPDSNKKTVSMPGLGYLVNPTPHNQQGDGWTDAFAVQVDGGQLTVTRTDSSKGWAQPLQLLAYLQKPPPGTVKKDPYLLAGNITDYSKPRSSLVRETHCLSLRSRCHSVIRLTPLLAALLQERERHCRSLRSRCHSVIRLMPLLAALLQVITRNISKSVGTETYLPDRFLHGVCLGRSRTWLIC